ncbi:putative iron-sulfur-binding oxidoreductase FadF [Nocardioides aquaticus]|uniref:Iron-sulfur-binding oxidoreductase FadF n=1 Tax=Nocardioides aquaticus TaxID=160826 RepID=A0ABX8EMV1_9ACTN|nr:(Fe-S)-binding protein [Nocardioides aquaticus]QVT81834.1 putative iron-sulfur-binding oxidoreductase FadF [Nocardioides aquaticus]
MQIVAIVVSLAIAAVGTTLFVRAIAAMVAVVRTGTPTSRTDNPVGRSLTLVKESLGHTRMLQWTWVGGAHWFVMTGFGLLFLTLVTAFGQLFDPHFVLPFIGHFFLFEWATELFTWVMLAAIVGLFSYRVTRPKERVRGNAGRLYRSNMWQGYFVEAVIFGVGVCIVMLRGLEYALAAAEGDDLASAFHFPLTFWIGEALSGLSESTLANLIFLVAMLKIVISFTWMIVVSLNLTMGVAWHRFTAFFNIWFKREGDGSLALGRVKPLTSAGKTVSLDDLEELDEDTTLGVGQVEDFSWKGLLDFTSCTECGRCQSQCPAWNTDKPLSPKLLITALRDHAYAKAPYLQADEGDRAALLEGNDTLTREVERPLVGDTGDDWFYNPDSGAAVIDSDVLWNCTSCGACVQQCPVDIEHVDHIIDMRRYAVLVESNFPAELNGLFKGLENKGNPWNMNASARLDWTKGLDFDVKVVGKDIESLDEVEWLFWVGCAGAYEDRAKKTTRAVAELLDMAGVTFGVLGTGETCTGDPARRAGNEFVFQGLAQQNVETMKEAKVKKVVSTCAHCFNTLKNEYSELGIELDVVHHTQLLNRLVREGRLTPVAEGAGAAKRSITYHDPCYIGRHNGVYSPPRELLQILPGAEVVEMERNSERSFCCGAGGARMWMEENIGERINMNRTNEAIGTGADQIAVGCPFCRVMLSDGLTAAQDKGDAREEVEVLDVAQMLLASVKGVQATKLAPGGAPATAGAAAAVGSASSAGGTDTLVRDDEATHAEPSPDDEMRTEESVTRTADAGPLAKASGGSSLFDTPAETSVEAPAEDKPETASSEKSVPAEARAAEPASSGGSLFDLGGGDEPAAAPAAKASDAPAEVPADKGLGGGSLFDLGGDEPAAKAEPAAPAAAEPAPKPATKPATDLGSGGSLFDVEADEPAPAAPAVDPKPAEQATAEPDATTEPATPATKPATDLGSGGSLFDVVANEPAPAAPAADPKPAAEAPATKAPEEAPAQATPAPATPAPASPAPASSARSTDPTRRSMFDIAAPAAPAAAATAPAVAEPEAQPEAEPAPTPGAVASEPEAAPAPTAVTPAPSTEIPEGGSLFDLGEPTAPAPAAPAPAAAPEPVAATSPAPADEDTETVSADAIVAEAAEAGITEPEAQAEAEARTAEAGQAAEGQPADEADAAAEPPGDAEQPAPSGEQHQPRTDADISGSSSLFDL